MFRSSVPGWIEKNDVLGKCKVMINGEAEDDTVFLGKNRNVIAAAIQIRLFILKSTMRMLDFGERAVPSNVRLW
jgi:hypothetical protein